MSVAGAAAAFGASEEMAARLQAAANQLRADHRETRDEHDEGACIEIWPENADAVRLFLAVTTQWRCTALQAGRVAVVVRTGIDYGVLPVVAPLVPVALTPGVFDQLRYIEACARSEMALADRRQVEGLSA